jgi:hypothetical protein
VLDGLEGRDPALARDPLQLGDTPIPDLAPGDVNDPAEGDRVAGIGDQAEVGEDILHLLALVEAETAHQSVGDPAAEEHVLEGAGLRIGSVEDGEIGERIRLGADQPLDLAADRERLLLLVVDGDEPDRLAAAALGPEPLGGTILIDPDHGVGGVEDGLAGAVVLLQGHHVRVGEVLLELQDVADVRAPEAVHTLVVVSDNCQVAMGCGQE